MTDNRLKGETSPYLRLHADDPVAWRPWGPEALAEARRLDRPILLSVGYFACHWCHVMAHESFSDPAIAARLNAAFVAIKLDREERPDLDALYQQALALMGQMGGWPLTMVLTPDAVPFWGGTYFPATPRFGRPAFAEVLDVLARAWAADRATILDQAGRVRAALAGLAAPSSSDAAPESESGGTASLVAALLSRLDPVNGGLLGAPKFPQPGLWRFLWRSGSAEARAAVRLTLDHLCQGGIYDHLGGGFMRYATDEAWRVPHFEKMLYDNAQLVSLLAEGAAATGSALYRRRIEETVEWLAREMTLPSGAFAAALDADSANEEGTFYAWTAEEIAAALPAPQAAALCRLYDVGPVGHWEGRSLLHRNHPHGAVEPPEIEAARAALFARRATRPAPPRDDKVLADWNAMMIAALAEAGLILDRPDWIERARRAFDATAGCLALPDNRLAHVWCDGRRGPPGLVEDLAQMALAALALAEATGEDSLLDPARAWLEAAERHHRDPAGGYAQAAHDARDLIVRAQGWEDSVQPSGNAAMAEALVRLAEATGDPVWDERARALFAAARAARVPDERMTSLLEARRRADAALSVTLGGRGDDPAIGALRAAALAAGWPAFTLRRAVTAERASAQVCRAGTCFAATDDPAALRDQLTSG